MKRVVKPIGYTAPVKENIVDNGRMLFIQGGKSSVSGYNIMNTDNNEKADRQGLASMPDMIIKSDNDGKILDIETDNEKGILAIDRKKIIGRHLDILFPSCIAEIHTQKLAKVLRTKKSTFYTYELETATGKPGHYEVRALKSNDNEVLFIIRDATKNKKERLSLIRGILEGEEKERKRVAQELHDGLGQIISALYMQVGTLSKKPDLGDYLQGPMKMIADIISEYRAISHNLMPPTLEDFALPDILKTLCERASVGGSCQVIFLNNKFKSKPAKYVIRELYRISQELIANAIKHSGCDTIEVDLIETPRHISIVVTDNGKGFDTAEIKRKSDGIGLKNIFARAEVIGGSVEFDSAEGKGTTVSITIPRPRMKNESLKSV